MFEMTRNCIYHHPGGGECNRVRGDCEGTTFAPTLTHSLTSTHSPTRDDHQRIAELTAINNTLKAELEAAKPSAPAHTGTAPPTGRAMGQDTTLTLTLTLALALAQALTLPLHHQRALGGLCAG